MSGDGKRPRIGTKEQNELLTCSGGRKTLKGRNLSFKNTRRFCGRSYMLTHRFSSRALNRLSRNWRSWRCRLQRSLHGKRDGAAKERPPDVLVRSSPGGSKRHVSKGLCEATRVAAASNRKGQRGSQEMGAQSGGENSVPEDFIFIILRNGIG